jgi:hypothetical protein
LLLRFLWHVLPLIMPIRRGLFNGKSWIFAAPPEGIEPCLRCPMHQKRCGQIPKGNAYSRCETNCIKKWASAKASLSPRVRRRDRGSSRRLKRLL